jgi:aspartate racemase
MKTLGLIGGLSWQSTAEYYRIINSLIQKQLGGNNSAQIVIYSVNFAEVEKLQSEGNWDALETQLYEIGKKLELQGADCILFCTNTMHKVSTLLESKLHIPFIHIIDTTAAVIKANKMTKVGLLGTKYTMKEDFYKSRLLQKHNIETLIPTEDEIEFINYTIFNELVLNIIKPESKSKFLKIISSLVSRGAQGVILGCTEIPLLVQQCDLSTPVFDTTHIHSEQAVNFALSK